MLELFLLLTLISPNLMANLESWPMNEWPKLKIEDNISYNELCLYDKLCEILKIRDSEEIKVPHPASSKTLLVTKRQSCIHC